MVTKAKKSAIITFVIVFTKHHFISINPFAFSVNKNKAFSGMFIFILPIFELRADKFYIITVLIILRLIVS